MSDGPELSRRARYFRTGLCLAWTVLAVALFPSWSTVAVVTIIGGAWIAGTLLGFMADEYWPVKEHTPRDWQPRRRTYFDGRRLR